MESRLRNEISEKEPPILRYVYAYPGLVLVIVQDMREGDVLGITTEEYELQEIG